ncbi:peptidyl-prolyl cis-trans isomerase, partial [Candidatus Poribacteria bacterium]
IIKTERRRRSPFPGSLAFWLSGLLAFWLSGLLIPCQSEIVDQVVAVVNGEPITLSMVEDSMNAIWVEPQDVPRSQQAALQKLINHRLKLQEARRLGADVIVSARGLSLAVAKIASRFVSPEEVSEILRRLGISQKDLEENLIEEIMVQEMVNRKFRLFVEITDIGASDYFEQHREEFVIPETVLLDTASFRLDPDADESEKEKVKAEAEEAFRKLKDGASFLEYPSEEGMTGYVSVDQRKSTTMFKPLIPVVAAAVARLKVGEISDLIETPVGYFIIKLRNRRPERPAVFNDVKAEIKELLTQQKTDDELDTWLKEQREIADIRILVKLEE